MGANSRIEWTDHTFNPWIGCSAYHTGCLNCYAEADFDTRRGQVRWGPDGTRRKTSEAYWDQPFAWNRQAQREGRRFLVMAGSLCDVFERWNGSVIDVQPRWTPGCHPC